MDVIGAVVAKYSGEHLHDVIFESKYFKEGNIREALRSGYLAMDDALRKGILGKGYINIYTIADDWVQ